MVAFFFPFLRMVRNVWEHETSDRICSFFVVDWKMWTLAGTPAVQASSHYLTTRTPVTAFWLSRMKESAAAVQRPRKERERRQQKQQQKTT